MVVIGEAGITIIYYHYSTIRNYDVNNDSCGVHSRPYHS